MRWNRLLLVVAVSCSGRSHDAGPTTSPDPAHAPATGTGPAARRGRPLDDAALTALAAVTVPGRDVTVARRGTRELDAVVSGPGVASVVVTVGACLGCAAMDLGAWEAQRAELAALWAPRDGGGDSLVLTAVPAAGTTAIAVDARRTLDGERRHTYQLHWNDGTTQLAAVCESSAPAADGGAEPDDGCAAAAATVLSAYLLALGI